MLFDDFDIADCTNESVDVVITLETSKSTLSTEVNSITIEVYNPTKSGIVEALMVKLRHTKHPGIRVLDFPTKSEIGLTIEIDGDALTAKLDKALRSAGCTTRVINK